MKKLIQLISIIFILFFYSSLFSQIEKKLDDEKLYKITNLTEVSKAIVESNNELHLGDFTGMIEDNSLEDKLIDITIELESSLGYKAYDIGLPSNCKNRENGIEEILKIAENSDIDANKYLLYSYFLDETELSLSCKIVDKDNPDKVKLFTISSFLNTSIESATKKEFSFLNKTSIEIYCLNLFISYFNSDDIVMPPEDVEWLYDNKTSSSENSTYVSMSGIVFRDEKIESLIFWNGLAMKHNPNGGSSINVEGLLVGFVKEGNTYISKCYSKKPYIFAGYAYIDKDRKFHDYNPPTVISTLNESVEATIGITFKNCPKIESCSHNDYIIEMNTFAIPDPNREPNENILKGNYTSYEELIKHINKVKLNTLMYHYANEWQEFRKTGDLPLFDPINIIYTHENPCEDIPVSYSNFISDYLKNFINVDPKFYFVEIKGYKMLLLYGPPPDNKMIAVKVDKDTDLTKNTRSSYYHFNVYCHRWEPLVFMTTAESDLFNLIGADITKLITDPHFQILALQGSLCIVGMTVSGGIAPFIILAADTGLSILDGALYFKEGKSTDAYLALGGAALGASGIIFKELKILLSYGKELKYFEPEVAIKKAGLLEEEIIKFYDDLRLSTNNLPPNTFGRNEWAAFFAEFEDEGIKIWQKIIKHPELRRDFSTLKSIKELFNTDFTENEILTIIENVAKAGYKCKTCTSGSIDYKFFHEVLDDIVHAKKNYAKKDNFDKVLKNLLNDFDGSTKGAVWVLDVARNKLGGNFIRFEHNVGEVGKYTCDIFNGKFIECKNWVETAGFLPQYEEQFVKQFAHTLDNIDNIDNMLYYWARYKPDESTLKNVLKNQVNQLNSILSAEKKLAWFETSTEIGEIEIKSFVDKFYLKIMK